MNVIVVLLLVALGVFSGFAAPTEEGAGEVETTPSPVSDQPFPDDLGPLLTDEAIEQRFLTRTPIEACAFVDLGDSMRPEPVAFTCLQEAVDAGEGAELILATIRPGGDQAYVYYRHNPDGPLEVFVDLRADERGRDWDYLRCRPSENLAEEPCA